MTSYDGGFTYFLECIEAGDYEEAADYLAEGHEIQHNEVKWRDIKRMQDSLRKRGLVVVQRNGYYCVEEI